MDFEQREAQRLAVQNKIGEAVELWKVVYPHCENGDCDDCDIGVEVCVLLEEWSACHDDNKAEEVE